MTEDRFFDVEPFRHEARRLVQRRQVERSTLVLGSTQDDGVVVREVARARGVEVVRRRGGGGAVLLQPGDHVWLDAWIPRQDVLWQSDVGAAAVWAGEWWQAALAEAGVSGLDIHTGKLEPGDVGQLVCFASRGPGEVFSGTRKVMGLSQWRGREGSLFSACAYARWSPELLAELVAAQGLAHVAIGVEELRPEVSMEALAATLLSSFDGWEQT